MDWSVEFDIKTFVTPILNGTFVFAFPSVKRQIDRTFKKSGRLFCA